MSLQVYIRKFVLVSMTLAAVLVQNGCILGFERIWGGGKCEPTDKYGPKEESKSFDKEVAAHKTAAIGGDHYMCMGEYLSMNETTNAYA